MTTSTNLKGQAKSRALRWLWSSAWILAGLGGWGAAGGQSALAADGKEDRVTTQPFTVEHIRIGSKRSFDDVKVALESRLQAYDVARLIPFMQKGDIAGARAELEKVASPTGLSILYSLNHGGALAMEGGGPRRAVGYGIGNVLVANSMTKHNMAAGLYAPVRVVLYEASDGTAVIEYDKPSSTFALFKDAAIDSAANRLDVVLRDVLKDIGK
jgi:uncharacterized protein (DUF302 family)